MESSTDPRISHGTSKEQVDYKLAFSSFLVFSGKSFVANDDWPRCHKWWVCPCDISDSLSSTDIAIHSAIFRLLFRQDLCFERALLSGNEFRCIDVCCKWNTQLKVRNAMVPMRLLWRSACLGRCHDRDFGWTWVQDDSKCESQRTDRQ